MIEKDKAFVEKRREFYEEHYRAKTPMDPWHAYAQGVVHSTTREWFSDFASDRGNRILNAGSGGSDYGITLPMVHLDLVATKIEHFPGFIVSDLGQIPSENSSFDVVLCVGSVINYTNPIHGIRELNRVLRPGGVLILEYERSGSPEYWSKHGIAASCARVETFYGNIETQLWVYGDQFINGLLTLYSFKTIKETRFHGLSSIALAITGSPALASRCVWLDKKTANLWPISHVASNRILAVEKLAHQGN